MRKIEEHVLLFMRSRLGMEAEKIVERPDAKTPDFEMRDGHHTYFVEFKKRLDDEEAQKVKMQRLDAGEVVAEATSEEGDNAVSNVVKKAVRQLDAKADPADFRLAWFHVVGHDSDLKLRRIQATLYGVVNLFDWESEETGGLTPCYFFENSEFYRHRQGLDGAILSDHEGRLGLCINSLSPRQVELRASRLASAMGDSVLDPLALEREESAFILDGQHDRKDESSLLTYLREKYGTSSMLRKLDTVHYSASILAKENQGGIRHEVK